MFNLNSAAISEDHFKQRFGWRRIAVPGVDARDILSVFVKNAWTSMGTQLKHKSWKHICANAAKNLNQSLKSNGTCVPVGGDEVVAVLRASDAGAMAMM